MVFADSRFGYSAVVDRQIARGGRLVSFGVCGRRKKSADRRRGWGRPPAGKSERHDRRFVGFGGIGVGTLQRRSTLVGCDPAIFIRNRGWKRLQPECLDSGKSQINGFVFLT